jgi:hypothetical protein
LVTAPPPEGTVKNGKRELTVAEQARLDELQQARELLSAQRAALRAGDHRTRAQRLASDTLLDYYDAAEILDLKPQTMRDLMKERRKHEREEGEARPTDLPEPDAWRHRPPRREPRWREGRFRAWAVATGRLLDEDALTPQHSKPSGRPKGSKNKVRF